MKRTAGILICIAAWLAVSAAQVHAISSARTVAARPGAGPGGEDLVTIKEGRIFLPQTPEAFIHDTDGNLTQDGRWNYTWDGENRLTAIETRTDINSSVPRQRIEFDYDDAGRRIAKRVLNWNTATSAFVLNKSLRFLYDGWNLVAEFNFIPQTSSFILLRSYSWGTDLSGSEQGAGGVGGLLFATVHSTPSSLLLAPCYDGNGNVTAWLEAATGAVSAAFDYDAFGNLLAVTQRPLSSSADAAAIPIGFSTKHRDAETGTIHYGLRDYSPTLARWLSADPQGEAGGINLAEFVLNDPVNLIDAIGLEVPSNTSYTGSSWTAPSSLYLHYMFGLVPGFSFGKRTTSPNDNLDISKSGLMNKAIAIFDSQWITAIHEELEMRAQANTKANCCKSATSTFDYNDTTNGGGVVAPWSSFGPKFALQNFTVNWLITCTNVISGTKPSCNGTYQCKAIFFLNDLYDFDGPELRDKFANLVVGHFGKPFKVTGNWVREYRGHVIAK